MQPRVISELSIENKLLCLNGLGRRRRDALGHEAVATMSEAISEATLNPYGGQSQRIWRA